MIQNNPFRIYPLCLIAAFAISCGGGGGSNGGGGGGGGGGGEAEDCSEDPFSVADLGGVLILPGDQSFSRANIGANGQLLWAWDQAIGHLDSNFDFEWILDASAEIGLEDRSISYATSDSGQIFANGQTSEFGAGSVDTWLCEYSCSGEVVSGSQIAYGSSLDESLVFLLSDTYLNRGFDPDDDTGEAHVHWIYGVHLPDPSDPTNMRALVGRIDSEAGTSWVRSGSLGLPPLQTCRSFNGGSLSVGIHFTGSDYEGYLVQLDTTGDVQWEVSTDDAYDIFVMSERLRLADDRILFTGYADDSSSDRSAIAIAVGPSGPEWAISLADDGDTSFAGAVQLPGGDIVAYGSVETTAGGPSSGLFVRMSTSGTVSVERAYGDGVNDFEIKQLALMSDGSITVRATVGSADAWVAKLNQGGIVQWQHDLTTDSFSGGSFEILVPAETESYTTDDVLVFGRKLDIGAGPLNADVIGVVIASTGTVTSALEWTNTTGLIGAPRVYTDSGTGAFYLFADITHPSGAGGEDALLVRYDDALAVDWMNLYGGANDDSISYLDFNAAGEILVSGITNSFNSTNDDAFLIGLGIDGETTQSCWVHDVTADTFTGISASTITTSLLNMTDGTFDFIPVDLLETPAYFENTASHTISSTSATLDDPCD
jgi:hypothetical protein